LTAHYVIMCSTQNVNNKQVMLTCYISFSLFHAGEQKNEKILCLIKQHPHNYKHTPYQKALLTSIAIFQSQKYCITTCNTKHAASIAIPVAILKSIAILIAIIAILQY